MFPHPDHVPPGCAQYLTGVGVPSGSCGQLHSPPVFVDPGTRAVLGASVPEAPVDEDSQLLLRERNVDRTASVTGDLPCDAIAEPPGVQQPAQRQLRCRIAPSGLRHASRDFS